MNEGAPKHDFAIREWWTRKTKKVSRYILISSIVAMIGSILFFEFASPALIARIQIFNGAMTLPVGGAIWIAAFIFQFLIPSREVAFRSQETLERTELRVKQSLDLFDKFMAEQAVPAIELLRKMVDQFEKNYSKSIESTIHVCQDAARNAVETAQKTEVMARDIHRDVLPMITAAARVIEKVEKGIDSGLLLQAGLMLQTVSAPGPAKGSAAPPDLGRALSRLSMKPELVKQPAAPPTPKKSLEPKPPVKPAVSFRQALAIADEEKAIETPHPRVIAVPVPQDSPEVERSLS